MEAKDEVVLEGAKRQPVTLRDYFAAAALQGLLASDEGSVTVMDAPERAAYAYYQADAMLAARDK